MQKLDNFFNARRFFSAGVGVLASALAPFAAGQFDFSSPAEGGNVSGLGLFSGWVCDAESVQLEFLLNGAVVDAAYGTERDDTQQDCGDTNNGFSFLFNFGNFPTGEQTVKLLVDGEEVATRTFNTIQLSEGAFVQLDETDETIKTSTTLTDFPKAGHSVVLSWDQASQNFVIASESIPVTGGSDVLQDGLADAQYDVGIFAFDQAINYAACGGTQDFASEECPSIAFAVVDDEDRGAVLEVAYLTTDFAGIVIDSSSPGIDMSAYESGLLNFDIKVVSAGTNSIYKVKLDDHNGGSTGEYDVTAANSGDWETFSVNMADLLVNVDGNNVGGNMSLTSLKAVVFMATYGETEDVVFRLDNVYFQQ